MQLLITILIAWAAMAVLMTGLWFVQRARKNAGIVDVAWSFGTGLCAVACAIAADGDPARRALIATLAGFWGLRLGIYLLRRVLSEEEDGRYTALREKWGDKTQRNLFAFFQIQAFWAVLFALPMMLAARNPDPTWTWYDWLGISIWIIGFVGESIADAQLARFRNRPDSRAKVCQDGLWRYSRHPNYFFEWLQWWTWVALGLAGPMGWLTILGPTVMLYFLFKVTGIPPTEARAIQSRGDAYRQYQQTTSAFFPWPPRQEATS